MNLRAAVYVRISVNDPDVPKVEDQESRCRKLAEANGYDVTTVYVDDGVSAYRSLRDRPGWSDLKAAAEASAFDVLLFDRQDRLARDRFSTLEFVALCGRSGLAWHSVDTGYIDLTDDMQIERAVRLGNEAEGYSRSISKNVARRNRTDREKGLPRFAGPRPFGWQRRSEVETSGRVTRRWMELDPDESRVIRQAIDVLLAGGARWDAVRLFNDSGLKTTRGQEHWQPISVYTVLRRALNAAVIEHKGEVIGEGAWPSICTLEELMAVRAIVDTPMQETAGKPRPTLLSGIIRCMCGRPMYAHGRSSHNVYQCEIHTRTYMARLHPGEQHTAIKIETADADARLTLVMRYLVAPDDAPAQDTEAAAIAGLYATLRDVRAARAKLDATYFAAGSRMTQARYDSNDAGLDRQEREALAAIADRARASAHAAMLTNLWESITSPDWPRYRDSDNPDARPILDDLYARFDALDLAAQRRLIAGTYRITVHPGRGAKRIEYEDV